MSSFEISFSVGDIVFQVRGPRELRSPRLDSAYAGFITSRSPEVSIELQIGDLSEYPLRNWEQVFDSRELWKLFRTPEGYAVVLTRAGDDRPVYRVALFSEDFTSGTVINGPLDGPAFKCATIVDPLEYPLAEIIMVSLLSGSRGIMAHACGVKADSRGFLFAGNSTAGKSTMAGIWQNNHTVLNDDRIILRESSRGVGMFGSPWHGDCDIVSPESGSVNAIFFLKHGDENRHERVNRSQALAGLFARIFPPIWDKAGVDFSLDFSANVVASIPCFELSFTPDESIVDYVLCRNWN
jgi:hypothetical protein